MFRHLCPSSDVVGGGAYAVAEGEEPYEYDADRATMRGEAGVMGAPTVEVLSVEEAQARRNDVLARVGGDEPALRARAAVYALDAHELAALDDLDALDYLLGRQS
jgi:hypothetical protein